MKKVNPFVVATLVVFGFTAAFAAGNTFTDQNEFAGQWFEQAAVNMYNKNIMTGIPDQNGHRFAGGDPVDRAQLAVTLDRFDEHMKKYVDQRIENQAMGSGQAVKPYQLQPLIESIERFDGSKIHYKSAIIMAESGLMQVSDESFGNLEKIENLTLPEGYEAYLDIGVMDDAPAYLSYKGLRYCGLGESCEVEEWYGPFDSDDQLPSEKVILPEEPADENVLKISDELPGLANLSTYGIPSLEGDILSFEFGFSGCNDDLPLELFWSGNIEETDHAHVNLELVYVDRPEIICTAYFEKRFDFDISAIKKEYQAHFADSGSVTLYIASGSDAEDKIIDYTF